MFTWICPQCGREVPPSYNECPDCAAKEKGAAQSKPPAGTGTPPPAPAPPSSAALEQLAPRLKKVVVVRSSVPGWMITALVAMLLLCVGAGVFFFMRQRARGAAASSEAPPVTMEAPAPAPEGGPHRLAKYIEVTGVRIIEEKQRARVRCVLVNHSPAELGAIQGVVALYTGRGGAPVATFPIKEASLGPWESREIAAALDTKLRAYEIPDWQFVRAELRITSP
jgi:hypothetical protein